MEDHNFEAFHLMDDLLLQADLTQAGQAVLEAESALWTLEQILCYAPELVGRGFKFFRWIIEIMLVYSSLYFKLYFH